MMRKISVLITISALVLTSAVLNSEEQSDGEKYTFTKEEKALLKKGRAVYWANGGCVNCHGATGEGDGPVSLSLNEQPKPFIFPEEFWKNKPTMKGIIRTLNEGIGPEGIMPSYQKTLSPEEMRAVAFFVLKLGNKLPDKYLTDQPERNPEEE